MVDYLTAQEIQDYFSRGMTSITVEVMPRLTDEAEEADATRMAEVREGETPSKTQQRREADATRMAEVREGETPSKT